MPIEKKLRKRLFYVAVVYTLFVIYGSLVPFKFEAIAFDAAWEQFWGLDFYDQALTTRSDWFANFLLFIPLNFLWMSVLWRNNRFGLNISNSALCMLLSVILCSSIEFTQCYLPDRVVSQRDIFAESLGSIFGLFLFWVTHRRFMAWGDRWFAKDNGHQWVLYLDLYLAGMFFYNLMPLDLTLNPAEVYGKWKAGKIHLIPFQYGYANIATGLYQVMTDIAIWIPVPLLWLKAKHLNGKQALTRVLIIACVMELCQLLVLSRFSDTTDLITAGLGGLLGIWVTKRLGKRFPDETKIEDASRGYERLGWTSAISWYLILFVIHCYPFEFIDDSAVLKSRFGHLFSLPFKDYWAGTEFNAITQIVRRVALALPLGIAIAFVIPRRIKQLSGFASVILMGIFFGLFMLLEFAQIFVMDHYGSPTDGVLGCAGAMLGLYGGRKFYASINNESEIKPEAARDDHDVTAVKQSSISKNQSRILFGFCVLLLYFGQLLLLSLDGVPYNVKENYGNWPKITAVGYTILFFWSFGYPFFVLNILKNRYSLTLKWIFINFGIHLVLTSLMAWPLLPTEGLDDIVGTPAWGIARWFEYLYRLCGLFAMIAGGLFLAGLSYLAVDGEDAKYRKIDRNVFGGFYLFIVLPVSYFVVVVQACTDNIIELLPNAGYSVMVFGLAAYVIMMSYLGLGFAYGVRRFGISGWIRFIVCMVVSLPMGYFLVSMGLSDSIHKYDKTFSALQFLLSPDREHYLGEGLIFLRFAVVHFGVIGLIGVTQASELLLDDKNLRR